MGNDRLPKSTICDSDTGKGTCMWPVATSIITSDLWALWPLIDSSISAAENIRETETCLGTQTKTKQQATLIINIVKGSESQTKQCLSCLKSKKSHDVGARQRLKVERGNREL